jgi:DNA sulfur modification protein DndB
MSQLDNKYCYSFPAVRGQQAGRPFYIATCPLRIIPKIFIFDEEEVPPELRAQRTLNKSRIPEMVRYLLDNPKDYVFSALTASVGTGVSFSGMDTSSDLGTLRVPMDAQILINDGQHRRKAIEEAIKECPELGQDNIPVLFFVDEGLKRSQQMFSDLNKHAVRPSPSISALYDFRDSSAGIARYLSMNSKPFVGYTEMEQSSVSPKSAKLFTLSSIKQATQVLLGKNAKAKFTDEELELAIKFWQLCYENIPEWQMTQNKELSPAQLRQEYIHAHGIGLHALGRMGHGLLQQNPTDWHTFLPDLKKIDWRKANPVWDNRALHHGKLSKTSTNVKLTSNVIRLALSVKLSFEDEQLEKEFCNNNV